MASTLTQEYGVADSHVPAKCWDVLIDSSQKQPNFCKQGNENKLSLQVLKCLHCWITLVAKATHILSGLEVHIYICSL